MSVVVPTHNRRAWLEKAVKSVLKQTYSNLEIIIINDASVDETGDYLRRLERQDSRFRPIHNIKPMGGGASRNIGLKNAHGEFIAFLDDDDEWMPDKIEKQVAFLKKHPGVAVVSCWYLTRSPTTEWANSRPENVTFRDILWNNFPGSFSFCMVRRSVIDSGLYLNESLTNFQDWEFWLRVSQGYSISILPHVLAAYNDHQDARISTSMHKKFITYQWFLDSYGKYMAPSCLAYHRSIMALCKIKSAEEDPKIMEFLSYFMIAPLQILLLTMLRLYFKVKKVIFSSPMPSYPYYLKKMFERY